MLSYQAAAFPTVHSRRFAVCRPARKFLGVSSAFHDPYATLGVDTTADERAVKKAFRKLALQYHPDVSKETGAEIKFLKLSEAYDFIIGKLRGKESSEHGDGHSSSGSGWEFHDWYWHFRASRSWSKQQRKHTAEEGPAAGPVADEQPSSARPSAEPGFARPESRQHLHCQLQGLRQRSAARACRTSASLGAAASPESSERELETPVLHHEAAEHRQQHQRQHHETAHNLPLASNRWWHGLDVAGIGHDGGAELSDIFDPTSVHGFLWAGHWLHVQSPIQISHGHGIGSVTLAYAAASEAAGAASSGHDASQGSAEVSTADECAGQGELGDMGFSRRSRQQKRFVASQERRESVTHQLAGLRRKASFAGQHIYS